ncbi:MAG TPA: winged helix DNA-binding domain-containing protein [Ktedonobacteraceae bacterium]|nr:winged helix DNA-binding domain-containing protein [Ktedonobacteraceae bacterium]
MAISLSNHSVRHLRLRAQLLFPQPLSAARNIAQVVQSLCGIQAQEEPSAALAIRARTTGLIAANVEQARINERSIVRTWGQRGTLHLLATEDIGWLLPFLGPVFIAGDRRRRAELGLDEDTCARAIHMLRNVLANQGPLTRAEIVEQLAMHSIRLEGQARPHLLGRAALEGVICFGPNRGTEPTYVLLSNWLSHKDIRHPLSEDAAYRELTRRYLHAYAPATPEDQAAWSGLPLSKTRAAWQSLADELLEVDVAGIPVWMLKSQAAWLDEQPPTSSIVRLLPRYDTYLLGYQSRDLAVPREFAKRINAGGGIVHPTLLVDGRVVGTWKSQQQKNQLNVRVEPFGSFSAEIYPGIEAEVADIGRFVGVQASLQVM